MDPDFLTLVDVAKMGSDDEVIGLIEEVTTVAPELDVLRGMPIGGTAYPMHKRIGLPVTGFRGANEGFPISHGRYAKEIAEAFIFGAEMQVDPAVVSAHPRGAAAALSIEGAGYIRSSAINLGRQLYYGDNAADDGFFGLAQHLDFVNHPMVTDAGGADTPDISTSVYFIWNDELGSQFLWGNDGQIDLDEWRKQQVAKDTKDGKAGALTMWVNNMLTHIGWQYGHSKSIGRLCNITSATGLTDEMIAGALEAFDEDKMPQQMFMTRSSRTKLQKSRSATTNRVGGGGVIWAPEPVESNGIPIVTTGSIINTEGHVPDVDPGEQ